MPTGPHQREFTRLPINLAVTLSVGSNRLYCPETRGVSLRGLFAYSADPLPLGSECQIELRLGGKHGLAIDLHGKVVMVDDTGMGIEFTELSIEALHHMRQLLLHNSEKPEQIEQEFHDHIGLKRP